MCVFKNKKEALPPVAWMCCPRTVPKFFVPRGFFLF